MIETAAALNDPPAMRVADRKPRLRSDSAEGFSYAFAAASLEKSAGASLKTFGATPNGAGSGSPPSPADQAKAAKGDAPARNAPVEAQGARDAAPPSIATGGALKGSPTFAAPSIAVAPQQTNAPQSAAPTAIQTAQAATSALAAKGAGPGVPEIAGLKPQSAPESQIASKSRRAVPPPTPPPKSPDDLARLIAHRLDSGATSFDLRLDPPALGRIDARLVVGDDGKTSLAIAFDNKAAFDLFARDEAALRLAFASAGYDFGERGLTFTLEEPRRPPAPISDAAQGGDAALARVADNYAAAVNSAGIVDIKV